MFSINRPAVYAASVALLAALLISCGSSSPEQSTTPAETVAPAVEETEEAEEASADTGKPAVAEESASETVGTSETSASEASKASKASSSTERLPMPRISTDRASEVASLALDISQKLPTTSLAALRADEAASDVCSGFNNAEAKKYCNSAIYSVDTICDEAAALIPPTGVLAEGGLGDAEECTVYFKAMIVAVADRSRAAEMCDRLGDEEQINICQVWAADLNTESDDICGFAGSEREMCLAGLVKFIGDLWGELMTPMLEAIADADCEDSSSDVERDRCIAVAAIAPAFEAVCELAADMADDSEIEIEDCQRIMAPMIDFLIAFMDVTFAAADPCYESYEEELERLDCMAISMLFASKAFCSQLPSSADEADSSRCFSLEEICDNLSSIYDSDSERCLEAMNLAAEGCEELPDRTEQESCQIAEKGCSAISVISRRDDCLAAIRGVNALFECTEASGADFSETAACLRNLDER